MAKKDRPTAQPLAQKEEPNRAVEQETPEPYEPPKLMKFEKLEKLIVSGE